MMNAACNDAQLLPYFDSSNRTVAAGQDQIPADTPQLAASRLKSRRVFIKLPDLLRLFPAYLLFHQVDEDCGRFRRDAQQAFRSVQDAVGQVGKIIF